MIVYKKKIAEHYLPEAVEMGYYDGALELVGQVLRENWGTEVGYEKGITCYDDKRFIRFPNKRNYSSVGQREFVRSYKSAQ